MYRTLVLTLVSSTALAALVQPAFAQTMPAQPGDPSAATAPSDNGNPGTANPSGAAALGDIVVTAQKQRSSVQKTPIALRVIDGDALTKAGVNDINSLTRLAPDLGITNDTIFTKLALRGVSAESIAEGSDAALTVNIDGEYINRPTALNAGFYDLDRIEVLKGPQGTLYGRNSTAGAINIITKKPTDQAGGYLTGSYGNFNAYTIQGAFNAPITDGLAFRIAGIHTQHKGYRDNDVDGGTGGHDDDANVDSVRGTLSFDRDRVHAFVQGEYTNINQSPPAQYGVQLTTATPGVVAVPTIAGGTDYLPLNSTFDLPKHAFPIGEKGFFHVRQYHIRGQLSYDLTDQLSISYVGGYFHNNIADYIPLNGFLPATFGANSAAQDSRDFSNELRLSYKGDNGLFIQAGGFYFNEKQIVSTGTQLPIAGGAYVNYNYRPNLTLNSYAAFGQADLPITDKLKVTVGGRYTKDKKTGTYYNFSGFGAAPTLGEIVANAGPLPGKCQGTLNPTYNVINQCYSKGKISWTGGVEYQATPRNLLYAKVSRGFRAGGFDNLTARTINGQTIGDFAPETITDYEIGSKNRFMNGKVELNIAAFHYDYRNLQVDNFIDEEIGAATVNAGKARYNGVETDFVAQITRNDRFNVTFNYLDAKLTQFTTFQSGLDGGTPAIDASGNRPPQAPKYTVAVGYDHTFDLGAAGTLDANAYTRFKSDYYLTSFNRAADRQEGYSQTDLSVTYTTANGRYSVQGYVHNVENYVPLVYAAYTGGGINIYNFIFGAPRTYGVQGTVKF